jgi:hypothetical protein
VFPVTDTDTAAGEPGGSVATPSTCAADSVVIASIRAFSALN